MKKLFVSFITTISLILSANAAFAQCVPATSAPIDGGFFPPDSTQQCAVKNQPYAMIMQLKNFGTVATGVYVEWTRVDTVYNLPTGLSWTMVYPNGNPANTLLTGEIGCLDITGTPTANAGVYVLDMWVTVRVNLQGTPQEVSGRASDLVPTLNTTFGTDYDLSYRIFVVDNSAQCANTTGIEELSAVNNLNVYPNPFSNKTVVSFNAAENGNFTARLTNIMGQEVYNENLNIVTGANNVEIANNGFSKGVYFFVLSNGNKSVSRRIVLE
jgi:hypothetical protein